MIVDRNYSTTKLVLTTSEALELIRQLADTVNSATRRRSTASFCNGTTDINTERVTNPGVFTVVVNAEESICL